MTTQTSSEPAAKTEAQTVKAFALELPAGIRIGYGLGVLALITCLVIASLMRPPGEWWFNVLLCLFGMAAGWTIGVLLSPMTEKEETKFTGFAKALSAFLTGFVVAKFDLLLKNFTFTIPDPEAAGVDPEPRAADDIHRRLPVDIHGALDHSAEERTKQKPAEVSANEV